MDLATMTSFTPWASLLGGILIGLSAVLLMAFFGRIAGISGITSGIIGSIVPLRGAPTDRRWRLAFIIGMLSAPLTVWLATGQVPVQTVSDNLWLMLLAGLLVGIGAGLGSGCTSGHGVCGLARLSPRSLAAVLTFMATGFATVFVLRHLI